MAEPGEMSEPSDAGGINNFLYGGANDVLTSFINMSGSRLKDLLNGDVIFYKGPILASLENKIKDALENIEPKKTKLIFVLETDGGSVEVVVRIVDTIRHHYPDCVEFIIPNYAFSAGTVLVLSGDEIHMDYFSVLGPTDPQVPSKDGRYTPALGYIERYNKLIEKAVEKTITEAEVTLLIEGFDQGRLQMYEHARELAKTLLKEWLPKYKFKDWSVTETASKPVTHEMRQQRADEIADELSDTTKWHSHGRGLSIEVLRQRLHLKIKDFGADKELKIAIKNYTGLVEDFSEKMGFDTFLHVPGQPIIVPFRAR